MVLDLLPKGCSLGFKPERVSQLGKCIRVSQTTSIALTTGILRALNIHERLYIPLFDVHVIGRRVNVLRDAMELIACNLMKL